MIVPHQVCTCVTVEWGMWQVPTCFTYVRCIYYSFSTRPSKLWEHNVVPNPLKEMCILSVTLDLGRGKHRLKRELWNFHNNFW